MNIAKGDYIAFVDSDDWLDTDMYLLMMESLTKHNADIAICSARKVYPDKNIDMPVPEKQSCVSRDEAFSVCFKYIGKGENKMFVWNKLYRRGIFDSIPKFNTNLKYCEDVPWVTKAFCKAEKFVFCHNALYFYRRQRKDSLSDTLSNGLTDPIVSYEGVYKELTANESGFANIAYQRMINYKNTLLSIAAKMVM